MSDEFEKIDRLERIFARTRADVRVGIGDDAAVLAAHPHDTVWTVDAAVEGVHFDVRYLTLEDVGYRAFVAAASDVLAMGALPKAALVALTLPPALGDAELEAIARGIAEAAEQAGAVVVGGNLARGPNVSLTTTVIGEAPSDPWRRRDARPGDGVYVTGYVGAAALGLALLQAGKEQAFEDAAFYVQRWRRPPSNVTIIAPLGQTATVHAAIDVSDGLLQDLGHLVASSNVGARIEVGRLPLGPSFRELAAAVSLEPIALALSGGEDYGLLFTAPVDDDVRPFATRIGVMTEGEALVTVVDPEGRAYESRAEGFRHFR